MGENKNHGNFYEVLYDYSFIDQSYDFTYPENKNTIHNRNPTLIPVPGFCFQTRTQQNKPTFINICHAIELPNCNVYNSRIHSDQSVLGFNLYLDDERIDREENGKISICYDGIIQTEFMDAILSHSRRDQRLYYLYQTACKAIFDRFNVRLESEVELLKKFYHGTMPESFRNVFKRIGVMSESDEDSKEPYFSDPFTVITAVRKFYTERKPEFEVRDPSIEYEIRQFPAENEFKGFMFQAILPYFSFLDPRDLKIFVSEKKLIIKENKTNHQFYFYLPNSISVMDCRSHFHEGKITIYLPRINPASCHTMGQYRRRPDPPRVVSPHETPPNQANLPQLRPHSEVTSSEVTHSQIIPSQIAHHQPTSQLPPRQQFPSHYQDNHSHIDNHQVMQSHQNRPQSVPHSTHFQPQSQRIHFQSNNSRLNQLQDCSPHPPQIQRFHYQLPPSQSSQHSSSYQMNHPPMAPSRMGHLQPLPNPVAHNRANPHYMGRYHAGPLIERHQMNSIPPGRHHVNSQVGHHPMDPTHIGHQSAPPRIGPRPTAPPQIGHPQTSHSQMSQLQMASSHLAQLQSVLSRQVHLQAAPSLLARLQATLNRVENLKSRYTQQTCPIQPKEIQTESSAKAETPNPNADKEPVRNEQTTETPEKDSTQTNSLHIADLQAALNEISDLQKVLLEAANFQVANLQAAILQITAPQRDEPQTSLPPTTDSQVNTSQTPQPQSTTKENENIPVSCQQTPYPRPSQPPAEPHTPASSP